MIQKTPFAPIFAHAAKQFGLDPRLLMAVARQESGFNSKAVSPAGAQGVMQLMPGTAKELGVDDPFDPVQNIVGGAAYLSGLMERFDGDVEKALAGYNWGPYRSALQQDDWKDHLPEETANYVPSVMAQIDQFEAPDVDTTISPTQPTKRVSPAKPKRIESEEASPLDKHLREIQTKFPRAVDHLREAEKPPTVDSLGSFNRAMLETEAERFGVEPQEVLDRSWELVQQEAAEAQEAVPGLRSTDPRQFFSDLSAAGGIGPRSTNPRRFFSDLSAARFDGTAFTGGKGPGGFGSGKKTSKRSSSKSESEDEFLGDILGGIGGGSSSEQLPPEQEVSPHPRRGGEFPIPKQSRAASERLRRLISQRLAQRRQRLAQTTS